MRRRTRVAPPRVPSGLLRRYLGSILVTMNTSSPHGCASAVVLGRAERDEQDVGSTFRALSTSFFVISGNHDLRGFLPLCPPLGGSVQLPLRASFVEELFRAVIAALQSVITSL